MAFQPWQDDSYTNEPLKKIDDPAWCMKCDKDIAFCACFCAECGASMLEDCNPGGDICSACKKASKQMPEPAWIRMNLNQGERVKLATNKESLVITIYDVPTKARAADIAAYFRSMGYTTREEKWGYCSTHFMVEVQLALPLATAQ